MEIQFIPQIKQTVWKRKAALNFILGGSGAGFYLSYALISILAKENPISDFIVQPEWLSTLLVCAGLLSVAFETGRPWRAPYVVSRLRSSWMSREALLAAMFIFLCILQWQLPHPVLKTACAAYAAGFMVAQGFILYASRAVPAWNLTVLPPFMVLNSFYAGCGLNLINYCVAVPIPAVVSLVALAAGIGDWVMWRIYLQSAGLPTPPPKARFPILKNLVEHGVFPGHLLPLGLIGLSMFVSGFTEAPFLSSLLATIAGVGMLIGSSLQKFRILVDLGWQRGIQINFQS